MSNTTEPTPQKTPTATDNLADAAEALFNKVSKVFQDPDVQSVFAIATAHRFPMDRLPQLTNEMNALAQALRAWKQALPVGPDQMDDKPDNVVPFAPPAPAK